MRMNLKKERDKKHLTQEQLAKELDVSEVFIRKLEAGTSNPSSTTAVELAEYFKKPLDYLFPDIFLLTFDTKCIKKGIDKEVSK